MAYSQHPNVDQYIETPGNDPRAEFHPFQDSYKLWLTPVNEGGGGGDTDISVMSFFFQTTEYAALALEAGETAAEGRVRDSDYDAFVAFVAAGEEEFRFFLDLSEGEEKELLASRESSFPTFEDAVNAFISGEDLSARPFSKGLLNGACFLRNERKETGLSGSEVVTTVEFYAIPGPDMFRKYRRNLNAPFWLGVMTSLKDASDVANMPLLNLDIAMQLRLGKRGQQYPPQNVGSGLVIFGAA